MLYSLLLLLLMATAAVSSDSTESTTFTITPSHTSQADFQPPGRVYLTLKQFQEQYMSGELQVSANITLDFMPGTHLLDSDLKINDTDMFVMCHRQAESDGSSAIINCTNSASFVFVNITQLEIERITFFGCGSWLIDWENHSAAIKIANVGQVWLSNITMLHSKGSAIAAMHSSLTISDTNIYNSSGSALVVDSCAKVTFFAGLVRFLNNTTPHSGGAIWAYKSNISTSDKVQMEFINNSADNSGGAIYSNTSSVSIFGECTFTGNTAMSGDGGAIVVYETNIVIIRGTATFKNNKAKKNGGAIRTYNVTYLEIAGTESMSFIQNESGHKGGAICVWFSGYVSLGRSIIFLSNYAYLGGGGIDVEITKDLQLSGSITFEDNHATSYGGAIEVIGIIHASMNISGDIIFTENSAQLGGAIFVLKLNIIQLSENIVFINNSAGRNIEEQGIGGAITVVFADVVTFRDTTFEGNSADIGGASAAINVQKMEFSGSSSKKILFCNNIASSYGGAIYIDSSSLHLYENVMFIRNSAYEGGGLHLDENSNCFLGNRVQVLFHENHAAMKGGAIFIGSSNHVSSCVPPSKQLSGNQDSYYGAQCALQWNQDTNVALHFVNNTAGAAGYALYGGSIDTCRNGSSYLTADFDKIINIEQGLERNTSSISSDPYKLCKCSPNTTECEGSLQNVYPGQNFTLHVLAFGQRNGAVPAIIVVPKASWINFTISNYHPQNTNATCSALEYAILPESNEIRSVKLELKPEGNCRALSKGLIVNINISECPTAFSFSLTVGCECSHELKGYTDQCSIDKQAIFRSQDVKFWVGIDENTSSLILYRNCPLDYCKPGNIWIPINDTDKQCNQNRAKLLCGECKADFSLMLGSSACTEDCSNLYLFLIVVFAVAGLALVVFLLALNLTVAVGTINGLVFYANVVHIQPTLFFPSKDSFLTVFIAWINLDLGIPTCFYRGMDMYAKTWLQFVFPVYIWVLCGLTIILSSSSYKLSKLLGKNPVAVLSTLFLLSYTKIVKTVIIALFSFTALRYPDGHNEIVWLYDANVSTAEHVPLIIVSVLLFFLLFPYTMLLFASQWFQRWSNYRFFSWMNSPRVKYFLDTYHAPFKPMHRYWTGLLLIVRVVLQLIISNVYSPINSILVLCVIISLLIMWQALVESLYRHSFQNFLEVSFLVNLEILIAASLYCHAVQSCDRTAVAQTSAGVAFATFVIILFYHLYLRLKKSRLWCHNEAGTNETEDTFIEELDTRSSVYSSWSDAQ